MTTATRTRRLSLGRRTEIIKYLVAQEEPATPEAAKALALEWRDCDDQALLEANNYNRQQNGLPVIRHHRINPVEPAFRGKTVDEQPIRAALIVWAKLRYPADGMRLVPHVTVLSLVYDQDQDEWSAELSVSSLEVKPFIRFWVDDQRKLHVAEG